MNITVIMNFKEITKFSSSIMESKINDDLLTIKIKSHNSEKEYEFQAHSFETIFSIKEKIYILSGFLPNQQQLIFKGKILIDDITLTYYKIQENSIIFLVPIKRDKSLKLGPTKIIERIKELIKKLHKSNHFKYKEIISEIKNLISDSTLISFSSISREARDIINDATIEINSFETPFCDQSIKCIAQSTDLTLAQIESNPDGLRILKSIYEEDINFENPEKKIDFEDSFTFIEYEKKLSEKPLPTICFQKIFHQDSLINLNSTRINLNDEDFWSENDFKKYLKNKFSQQVAILKKMGFDDEQIILQALGETNGNVQLAAQILQNKFFFPY